MTKPASPRPQRYILCIGKWTSLALTAEKYGFELVINEDAPKPAQPQGKRTKAAGTGQAGSSS